MTQGKPAPETSSIRPSLAQLSFQQDTPYTVLFDDIYFSSSDGISESRYVFLHHNRLLERFQALHQTPEQQFTIAETGFGTGLNFLLSCLLWQQVAPDTCSLNFYSVEQYPLSRTQLQACYSKLFAKGELPNSATEQEDISALQQLAEHFITQYPNPSPGLRHCTIGRVNLFLYYGELAQALEQWPAAALSQLHTQTSKQQRAALGVNAWFLDGFAPAKNPSMWSPQLFSAMREQSAEQASFATFTAAGDVRRGLQQAGFKVSKNKGYGRKRDMLCGQLAKHSSNVNPQEYADLDAAQRQPAHSWNAYFYPLFKSRNALVIGAGIAGATTAWALAQAGWKVHVAERGAQPAAGASGNRQSVLYSRLAWPGNVLTQFNLDAFEFAQHYYQQLVAEKVINASSFTRCGVLQLAFSPAEEQRIEQLAPIFLAREHCELISAQQASAVAGIPLNYRALWFKRAGWVKPKRVCLQLLNHPNITVYDHYQVSALDFDSKHNQWISQTQTGQPDLHADIAIMCNAASAQDLLPNMHLPIKTIRGQVSHWPATTYSNQLKSVICHQGYVAPAVEGAHDIGATFNLHDKHRTLSAQEHAQNLAKLEKHVPELARNLRAQFASEQAHIDKPAFESIAGRAELRCVSNDYLPIIGNLCDHEALLKHYAPLRKNARQRIDIKDTGLHGLFVNIAHGSRGLSSAPLASAHIASLLARRPSPVAQHLHAHLHPARFSIRKLKKKQL